MHALSREAGRASRATASSWTGNHLARPPSPFPPLRSLLSSSPTLVVTAGGAAKRRKHAAARLRWSSRVVSASSFGTVLVTRGLQAHTHTHDRGQCRRHSLGAPLAQGDRVLSGTVHEPVALYQGRHLRHRLPHCRHSWLPTRTRIHNLGATHRCLLYTSPSPRDQRGSRMPSSA